MRLTDAEAGRFYAAWRPLLSWVNDQLALVDLPGGWGPKQGIDLEHARTLRDALWADDALLDRFVTENPKGLTGDLLHEVAGWRHRRSGRFVVSRHHKSHTVFLEGDEALGVLGLYSALDEILPMPLPVLTEAVLLPFAGRIVIDGLLLTSRVSFGPGIRRDLDERYRAAIAERGLRTSLDPGARPPVPRLPRPRRSRAPLAVPRRP